jgi:hypothetical protein
VVAERDHVGAGGQDLVRELRGDPDSVRGVLAVHDAEPCAELGLQRLQPRLERPSAGWAEDVCDEEDDQLGALLLRHGERAGRMHFDVDVLATVLRVTGESGLLH